MAPDQPDGLHSHLPDGSALGVPEVPGLYVPTDSGSEDLLELLTQLVADLDAEAPDSPDLDALWDRIDRNLP